MNKTGIGIIGCGNISSIYLENLTKNFDNVEVIAVADINEEAARSQAEKFGVKNVLTVDEILAREDISIIVNLTIPKAHYDICKQALEAGKHVYVEKPLSLTTEQGMELKKLADEKGLYAGGAPDTFLGGGIQSCIKMIQDGEIGTPVGATINMACRGHETWHPAPEFYYKPGGGPLLDMGPYYITCLVSMLGPVKNVMGNAKISFAERTITSEPKNGEIIKVETPTHILGILEFESGVIANMTMSFDTCHSTLPMVEVYGSEGTISVPDPNTFGGNAVVTKMGEESKEVEPVFGYTENSRGLGVSDMATAIQEGRPARAGIELTSHVLEIMNSVLESAKTGQRIELKTTCARPKLLADK